jgi:hypothetical protein
MTDIKTGADEGLRALIPPISRAREFRLYTGGGRRLLDLWQYGGAALLGHTPPGALRVLKNTAQRGLFAPFPGPLEGRFLKALKRLFPRREFRLYADEASLRAALAAAGFACPGPFPDPAADPAAAASTAAGSPEASLWRPFLEASGSPEEAVSETVPALLPVLPLPWPCRPWAAALDPAAAERFPPSDTLSPVILGGAARAVYDLIAAAPERGRPFPRIEGALKKSPWIRRGIYLRYREPLDQAAYEGLFRRFLDRGFLLPPDSRLPAILPGVLSPGEEAQLAALLAEQA